MAMVLQDAVLFRATMRENIAYGCTNASYGIARAIVRNVSHRLSTLRDASHIIVMKARMVDEQGGHDRLLAHGGVYAEIFNAQMEQERAATGA